MMKHIEIIPLETDRLILRRFASDDDLAIFANWANDPDVGTYSKFKKYVER